MYLRRHDTYWPCPQSHTVTPHPLCQVYPETEILPEVIKPACFKALCVCVSIHTCSAFLAGPPCGGGIPLFPPWPGLTHDAQHEPGAHDHLYPHPPADCRGGKHGPLWPNVIMGSNAGLSHSVLCITASMAAIGYEGLE
jgi:hypothetical protein